jgi:deoxyribose-phosphate aldolase
MSKTTDVMKMIDHSLLHPGLTDQAFRDGCELAKRCRAASVCVKPYAVKDAAEILAGSNVLVGAVIGFPHGNNTPKIKLAETEQVIRDGAVEVDMVINVGKALSGEWDYVEKEIKLITDACHAGGAKVKVIFANDLLPDDATKIQLCEICSRAKADWVKTSTGYNYVKGEDGKYFYRGATDHDLKLMREHSAPEVQVKAAGCVRTLEAILHVREAFGVTRIGTSQTENILAQAKAKFGE